MNPAETLIRAMSKTGCSASRIAEALYDRDMKNGLGRTYTAAMVEGFLRYTGLDEEQLIAARNNRVVTPESNEEVAISEYSKDAVPIADPLPRVRMLRPWPLHTDFRPDNLNVRD